jgi:hypothetical protein
MSKIDQVTSKNAEHTIYDVTLNLSESEHAHNTRMHMLSIGLKNKMANFRPKYTEFQFPSRLPRETWMA